MGVYHVAVASIAEPFKVALDLVAGGPLETTPLTVEYGANADIRVERNRLFWLINSQFGQVYFGPIDSNSFPISQISQSHQILVTKMVWTPTGTEGWFVDLTLDEDQKVSQTSA